jgi:hypothetical protein
MVDPDPWLIASGSEQVVSIRVQSPTPDGGATAERLSWHAATPTAKWVPERPWMDGGRERLDWSLVKMKSHRNRSSDDPDSPTDRTVGQ